MDHGCRDDDRASDDPRQLVSNRCLLRSSHQRQSTSAGAAARRSRRRRRGPPSRAERPPGSGDAGQDRRLLSHNRRHRRCRSERRGARGRRRQDRRDRPHRPDPQDVSAAPRSTTDAARRCLPGLINCHAHLAATLARGFNEDFGFPNSARLAVQPNSLLQGEEATLMVTIGALEAIRTGTTTIVENSGGISRSRRGIGADRTALRVRGVGPRQRERCWPDVAGGTRQE